MPRDDAIETERVGAFTLKLYPDPDNPREWDNPSVMVCDRRQYNLDDRQATEEELSAYRHGGEAGLLRHLTRPAGSSQSARIGTMAADYVVVCHRCPGNAPVLMRSSATLHMGPGPTATNPTGYAGLWHCPEHRECTGGDSTYTCKHSDQCDPSCAARGRA